MRQHFHPHFGAHMSSAREVARYGIATCFAIALGTSPLAAQRGAAPAPRPAPINANNDPLFKSFWWRSIGPADQGGRVDDIAVVENNPRTYYVGYATGGVWKTTNGGTTFESIFDTYNTIHVGAVAVAPSAPDIVWVGTGEGNNRNSTSYGDGIFKSVDGGKTFTDMGLKNTRHIHRIAIHPRNPDVVFAAAQGSLWGPNPERGIYRTTDGGRSWNKVLYIDEYSGGNNVVIDPSDPNVVYASLFQRQRTAWGYNGGGPGSGIWKSTDGGATFERLRGNGLPNAMMGRIALDVSRSNPNIVYAQIEVLRDEDRTAAARRSGESARRAAVVGDNNGGIWRSNDKGRTWEFRSNHNVRPGYFSKIKIDPQNPEVIYTAGRNFYRSEDGAKTFRPINGAGHGDYHAIWVNPRDSDHFMVGNDGGFDQTFDRGRTFESMRPNAVGQFYQVSVDMRRPYFVCGGLQDNSSWCGPSAVGGRFISPYDWYNVGSGDGGYTAVDPTDPAVVYAEGQRGSIRRINLTTGEARQIQPRPGTTQRPSNVQMATNSDDEFRWNWTTPFLISWHNPNTLYIGGNHVFKSTNRGDNWTMGPDLTRKVDRDTLAIMGVRGNAPDCHGEGALAPGEQCILSKNDGTWFFSTISTLAESPVRAGVLWAGTDDGNVQVSQTGLTSWTNVTANIRGAPQGCVVSRVEASYADAAAAYASIDCHRSNDFRPYVFSTKDYGRTWANITNDLPAFGAVKVVKQDPKNHSILYVGTEFGFFLSLDEGKSWKKLMTGLPPVRIDDVVIHPRDGDLVLGTHGRSVFIMDDITPLQQFTQAVAAKDVHFFEPRSALLMRNEQRLTRVQPGSRQYRGTNADPGVALHYYLKQPAQGPVKITISDAAGRLVRTLEGPNAAGINRVQWNLFGELPPRRTVAEDMEDEPAPAPPRVSPGRYRVTLTVNGADQTRTVVVEDAVVPWTATQPRAR
jgi:photosystem II stability/assembly factor-like uncharacterized protein